MNNINSLMDNLTYNNWFTQIAVITDAYEEYGLGDEACVCRLFLARKMIPERRVYNTAYYDKTEVYYIWYNAPMIDFARHFTSGDRLPFCLDISYVTYESKDISSLFLYAVNRLKVWYPYHELRYIVECEQEGKAP